MKRKIIFVIGSKPDAIIPEIKPDKIYFANTSIKMYEGKYDLNITNLVFSNLIFSNNEKKSNNPKNPKIGSLKTARDYIRGVKCNDLILLHITSRKVVRSKHKIIEDFKQYIFSNRVHHIYLDKVQIGMVKLLNIFWLLKSFRSIDSIKKNFIFLYKLIFNSIFSTIEVSTGVHALYWALENNKDSDIFLIGSGINPNSGYSFKTLNKFSDYHISADLHFVSEVRKRCINNNTIFITDPELKSATE
jgi:hypothetical protein